MSAHDCQILDPDCYRCDLQVAESDQLAVKSWREAARQWKALALADSGPMTKAALEVSRLSALTGTTATRVVTALFAVTDQEGIGMKR